jgi:hypothetical protein
LPRYPTYDELIAEGIFTRSPLDVEAGFTKSESREPELGQASDPLPVFQEPTWGSTLEVVSSTYPNGQVVQFPDEETHYRVAMQAYDQPTAIVTYCFRREIGLRMVVIDIAGADTDVDLFTGDFMRPNSLPAFNAHRQIRERLETLYGSAKNISGRPGLGGMMRFGREDDETTVRLDSKQIDREQINLTVWQANRGIELYETNEDENITAGLWRTNPSTWSDDAFFDVKWGMGPGDVRDNYHDLISYLPAPDNALHKFSANTFIEWPVGIQFEFLKGRLVGISISPWHIAHLSSDSNEQKWMEWELWQEDITEILTDKYSVPEPAWFQMTFGPTIGPDSPPNAWFWHTNSSAIGLKLLGRAPVLECRERGSLEEREKEERDQEEREESARRDKF